MSQALTYVCAYDVAVQMRPDQHDKSLSPLGRRYIWDQIASVIVRIEELLDGFLVGLRIYVHMYICMYVYTYVCMMCVCVYARRVAGWLPRSSAHT
jgi:hypothetical protein